MTETNGGDARDETREIAGAKRGQEYASTEAARAWGDVAVAGTEAERLAEELRQKDRELAEVAARCEALRAELSSLPLDDPGAEKPSGQLLHATLVKDRLTKECEALRGSLVAARGRADHLRQRAEMCEATARNAGRNVELVRLMEAFPGPLDQLLGLVGERNRLLGEADEESRASGLSRLPRRRLFPRQNQLRGAGMEELLLILGQHVAGLTMTPSAPFAAFSLAQGNGDEGPAEPEVPAQPEDEWIDAVIAEQEIAELEAGMPLEET